MTNISVLITNGSQLLFQLINSDESGGNKYMLPSMMAPTLIGAQRKIKKVLGDLGIGFYFIKEIFNKNEGECNHCIYLCSTNQYVISFKEKNYKWIDISNCNDIPIYNVFIDAQKTIVKYIRIRLEIINRIEEIIISVHDQSLIKLDFVKKLNGIQVFMGSAECGCPFSYSFIFDFIEEDKSEYQINWVLNQSLAPGDKSDIYILFSETMGALLKLLLLEPVLIGRMKHIFFDKEISSANILFESNAYNGVIDGSSIVSKAVSAFELFNLVMGLHGAFFGSISHEKNNNENQDIIKCLNKKQLNYVVRDEHACYYDDEATCIVVENGTYDVSEFLKGYEFELIDGIYCKLLAQKIQERVFLNYIDNSDWVKIQKIIKRRKFTDYKLLAQSNRIYLFSGQEIWTINGCFHHDIANIEREQVLERNEKEQALLLSNREFSWKYPVDCGRFEMLCADLLEKMHTTSKIRIVGSVNNADEGRDILIYNADGSLYLCQCKAYQKNIGKSNVRDIRDTIEYHGASGFLLMVSSGVTAQLINHLEALKMKYKVEWYTEREIFKLLRQYPSIADTYRDIIEINENM